MPICYFVTDLHGQTERYQKLIRSILHEHPAAVFLGGDLLAHVSFPIKTGEHDNFVANYLVPAFREIRTTMGADYPDIFLILGNDDPRCVEQDFIEAAADGLWYYLHGKKIPWKEFQLYGLAYVPPTPFLLKDWERYDVSRHIPPGCLSPEEGYRSVEVEKREIKWITIREEIHRLAGDDSLDRSLFLFHSPPHDTPLDRAALDEKYYENVSLDLHVGSVAVRRFIEERQPLITMHGHVHESTRLTGNWKIQIGRTTCFNAAHDGPELSLVRFDPKSPAMATRELL